MPTLEGRLDEAKTIVSTALQRKVGGTSLHELLSQVAELQGDIATQQREDTLIKSSPAGRLDLVLRYAGEGASHGQLRKSQELATQGQSLARQMSMGEVAAGAVSSEAMAEAEFGLSSQARKHAAESPFTVRSRDILLLAAFTFALGGDDKQAHNVVADIAKQRPQDGIVQFIWLPAVQAAVELRHGNAETAIQLLMAATPYDDGTTAVLYTRGSAYLRAGRAKDAETEFQKSLGAEIPFYR